MKANQGISVAYLAVHPSSAQNVVALRTTAIYAALAALVAPRNDIRIKFCPRECTMYHLRSLHGAFQRPVQTVPLTCL
jgi:hypothetical protein